MDGRKVRLMPLNSPQRQATLIRAYMPELDSARGLAILLVLIYHGVAAPANAELIGFPRYLLRVSELGWVGVNLFFVLSGFLITGILLDTRTQSGFYRRFYIRRAARILPALYTTLVVLLAAGWISWRFLILSTFFVANFAPLLGTFLQYGPLWSLAVEEHFYLIWPAAIRRFSWRTLAFASAAIFVATPFARAVGIWLRGPSHFEASYTWFNFDGLALGALIAITLRHLSLERRRLWFISFLGMITGAGTLAVTAHRPPWGTAVAASASNLAFAGFLITMLLLGTSRWSFLVNRPFLKFLGFISYGLYLAHVLAFRLTEILFAKPLAELVAAKGLAAAMLLRFVGGATLGILVAYLSRHSLEDMFLRLDFGSRTARPTETKISENTILAMPSAR